MTCTPPVRPGRPRRQRRPRIVLRDSLLRIVAAVGMDARQADAALTVLTGRRLIRPLVGRQTWQLLGER